MNSHPILGSLLLRLFNLFVYHSSFVPSGFYSSYTIPLLKAKDYLSKSLECADFRGVAVSNIFSKCFEYCLLEKFAGYLETTDNQFGFKLSMGCNEAIFTARRVIETYVDGGDTAHVCALDVSKAFDKVNQYGLFLKLMKRNVPSSFLGILVKWLPNCFTCVKWRGCYSPTFKLSVGIRQGSVLAPILFSVYVNDILRDTAGLRYGEIIMYADDILIIVRSVSGLQYVLNIIETELSRLDLRLNGAKSECLRIGARYNSPLPSIVISDGSVLRWVSCLRYLGSYFLSGRRFECSLDVSKRAFSRAVNSILCKIAMSNEDVILHLIKFKCMPILLYSTECTNISKRMLSSLDFCVMKFLMKIFKTTNRPLIDDCLSYFGFTLPSVLIARRVARFTFKIKSCANLLVKRFS